MIFRNPAGIAVSRGKAGTWLVVHGLIEGLLIVAVNNSCRDFVLRYVPEWINPRWVVLRDGQVVRDAVLNPTEIYTLPNRVRRWQAGE